MKFLKSSLWKNAFSNPADQQHEAIRNRLNVAYEAFWKRGCELAKGIANDLPNLTLHDEQHFEALWQRAGLVAGPLFTLNPLEAFVFGGAILLHDAGHAVGCYAGGLPELKQTPQWKDAVVSLLKGQGRKQLSEDEIRNPEEATARHALFETLRLLHAERATSLASLKVKNVGTGDLLHLIEDDQLRIHLGSLIGQIAASHHWNIEDLETRLKILQGPPSGFPNEWTIQPIKLACLLRCADAIQIDQERAPDFSFALLKLSGVSESHWRGQNRIAIPVIDQADSSALIFTSTVPFSSGDAAAWWVVHDAVTLADRELEKSQRLLIDIGQSAFQVSRIKDADSPRRLASHISTVGWHPVSAEVRVGNVTRVIEMFGGSMLYGPDISVPLRELIQNAADAVRARRALEPKGSQYAGRVTIRLDTEEVTRPSCRWLHVEDDGLGMSERVLTGTLIDFGSSYWSSNALRAAHPGLIGKQLRQSGKYGIGFFSVLMASSQIKVASRAFNAGQDSIRSLAFEDGLNSRPILLEGADPQLPMTVSTRVSLLLKQKDIESLLQFRTERYEGNSHDISLGELVGHLTPMLDVDVYVGEGDSLQRAHSESWQSESLRKWIDDVALIGLYKDSKFDAYLEQAIPLLREITEDGQCLGLACIGFNNYPTGSESIGGLISGNHSRASTGFSAGYVGTMARFPDGPRRFVGSYVASEAALAEWASEQAQLLQRLSLTDGQFYWAANSIANFGGNSSPIARILVNRKSFTIPELFEVLKEGALIAPRTTDDSGKSYRMTMVTLNTARGSVQYGLNPSEIEFQGKVMEGYHLHGLGVDSKELLIIPNEAGAKPASFLGMLQVYCASKGRRLVIEAHDEICFGQYRGATSTRERIKKGHTLKASGVKIFLEDSSSKE